MFMLAFCGGGRVAAMIEIQCTSCNTRYRIDERVLPEDTPTFKCSRCGHVFSAEPRGQRRPAQPKTGAESLQHEGAAAARKVSTPKPAAPHSTEPPATPSSEPTPPRPEPQPPAQAAPPAAPESRPAEARASASEASPPPPADELARPFNRPADEPTAGENLSFDFDDTPMLDEGDEPDLAASRRHEGWKVGDEEPAPAPRRPPLLSTPLRPPEPSPMPEEPAPALDEEPPYFEERRAVPGRAPYVPESGPIHSTGFLVGIFILVAIAFGGGSLLICNAPVASAVFLNGLPLIGGRFAPPIVPARLVAIKDVNLSYRTVKGSKALVVTGKVVNVGRVPLHTVELAATLQDSARRPLAGTTIYCGNSPAPAMIGEMTPRELEFLQHLEPPRHFVLKPMTPAPFTMVFVSPPSGVSNLAIAVARAIPASADELAQTAAAN